MRPLNRILAVAAAALVAAPLAACAATAAPTASTIAVDVADGSPTGDAIAIPGGLQAGLRRGLDALPGIVRDVLERSGVPGMSVAVVAGGETVLAEGYGTKVAGKEEPVDADTVFQIASVSKSLTGTVIAKAVSDGLVTWDTPVRELLPGFALGDPYVTDHGTIGDYMSHRSGLYTGAGDDLETLGFDRATVLDRLRLLPLAPFRSSYNYSNFGITVAGEATAAAAGTSWEQLAEDTLFAPLGMGSTSFRYDDYLARADRATINALVDGSFAPRFQREPDPQAPAGDLVDARRPASPAPPAALSAYAGVYRNDYFGDLVLSVEGDRLVGRLGPTGGFEIDLEPWDGDVFAFEISGEEAPPGSRSSASFAMAGGQAASVVLAYFDRWGLGTFLRAG